MLTRAIVSLLLLTNVFNVNAQTTFTSHPDSSVFLTADIDRFWNAFDKFKKDTSVNPFGKDYVELGSPGVKGFLPGRIQSAEHLYKTVKARTAAYERVRPATFQMAQAEAKCRAAFHKLKAIYPEAQFPPVYFVIGAFNSGGTFSEDGIMIGAERQPDLAIIPFLVAHEAAHFQQKTWSESPTLLQQSIVEGAADFIGELTSGGIINEKAFAYGRQHEEALCREFVTVMDSVEYQDWLYGVSGKDGRPNDLGYWMGYQIVSTYYKKAANKNQAIKDILWVTDYRALLDKSGYLAPYLPGK
ncbi:DUF2268 domain-containing protein [Chitinophaga horti]|uniref:DUF2268 domain-containing protein n=1 Tax=Chitinophaga horti TaxID=2920382 RepID=A0ABY6IZE9_9BACT|nr:DUF2268 domain-containing protein [Chitinophaga horti]UYQ92653.1 DUF2268 domain-containing protein [Chitinophaga horti]